MFAFEVYCEEEITYSLSLTNSPIVLPAFLYNSLISVCNN